MHALASVNTRALSSHCGVGLTVWLCWSTFACRYASSKPIGAREAAALLTIGAYSFASVAEVKSRVRRIQTGCANGQQLKSGGAEYYLVRELVRRYHPTGSKKLKDEVGIKVDRSRFAGQRCFWVVRGDGSVDDFSSA